MEDKETMEDTPTPEWEDVCDVIVGQDYTQRLRVDTGWVYARVVIAGATTKSAGQVAVGIVFVPDRATP